MAVRTSESDPLAVDWLPREGPGRVGLTLAPGRKGPSAIPGQPWDRDTATDLRRLVEHHRAGLLVPLIEEFEQEAYQIGDLHELAFQAGLVVQELPIRDGGVPESLGETIDLVDCIRRSADEHGEVVVIHCIGGLGRSGTIAGCVLVEDGRRPEEALGILRQVRGPRCPENDRQREFIARYAAARDSRVAGCLLGAAIGDALGHPTEFLSMEGIRRRYGPDGVTGFELWWERDGRRFAPYTDDTQMAEVVLRALLEGGDEETVMLRMADGFVTWADDPQGGHRAPGNACLAGCRALAAGAPWREAGGAQAGGCGSVMRAHPCGMVFADDPTEAARWAVAQSLPTHRDPIALAASAAMATGVALAIGGAGSGRIMHGMMDAARAYSAATADDLMARAVSDAFQAVGPEIALDRLRGWAAHEAIAAALYIFCRHRDDDPAIALLEGANTPGDSDSIASMAGALVGARLGLSELPSAWVRDVERSEELQALAARILR